MSQVSATMSSSSQALSSNAINFAWLIKLRWSLFVGELVLISGIHWGLGMHLSLSVLFALVGLGFLSNLGLVWWQRRGSDVSDHVLGVVMLFDLLLLTGILYVTGGPANPFSFLYLVYIALGLVVLGSGWMWWMCVWALLCYGSLFLRWDRHQAHGIHTPQQMRLHLEGMWVAYAITTVFIGYFVARLKWALARREEELAALHNLQMRSDKIAALAGLASGAVHEFSTPLSTIALVAKEVEHALEKHPGMDVQIEDLQLIRSEVDRCKRISQELMIQAGETLGEASQAMSIESLFEETLKEFPAAERVQIEIHSDVRGQALPLPQQAFVHVLRSLLKNAEEASTSEGAIALKASIHHQMLRIEVVDQGAGMTPDVVARLGEPFFTTKAASEGHGLSIFLTRTLMERLNGDVQFTTAVGEGTTVTLLFPLPDAGQKPHSPNP